MRAWADVAVLAKTRNLKGRFVARAAAGLPFLLEQGDEVAFVPPQLDVPRRAVVEEVVQIDETTAEITFEGIDGDIAEQLVGSHCIVARSKLDNAEMEGAFFSWEGWSVVDGQLGEIGTVSDVFENPGQALMEVARPDGSTVLVPLVDEIVLDVDHESGVVHVALPKGILDL